MENKIRFGIWEAVSFLVILIGTQTFLNFPRSMAEAGGTAGWLLTLYLTLLAFILLYIIFRLYRGFEGKDLIDILEGFAGKPGRVILGLILSSYFIFICSVVLREFAEHIKTIALVVSPISFVLTLFITGMILGAYMGLEALVRISAIVVPVVAIGFFIIIAGSFPYFNIANLGPVLGTGPYPIFFENIPRLSIFSAILVLFLIYPYIGGRKNFEKTGYIAVGIAAFLLFASSISFLLTFPYSIAIESFLPMYQLARLINFGRFFQRIESIFVIMWAAGALIYLSSTFFLSLILFKKAFNLKFYKPLIFPFAVIVFTISLIPRNLISAIRLETQYFRTFAWIITFVLTIVILILAKAIPGRSKKRGTNNA